MKMLSGNELNLINLIFQKHEHELLVKENDGIDGGKCSYLILSFDAIKKRLTLQIKHNVMSDHRSNLRSHRVFFHSLYLKKLMALFIFRSALIPSS